MTITPPPDESDLPDEQDVPSEFPEPEAPLQAPGDEDLTQPPLRMPSENPDVETEL